MNKNCLLESATSNLDNLFSYKKPVEKDWLKVCLKQLSKRKFKIWFTMFTYLHRKYDLFITRLTFKDLWIKLGARCHIKDHTCPDPYDGPIEDFIEYWKKHPYYFFDVLTLNSIAELFPKHCTDHVEELARIAETLYLKDTRAAFEYIIRTLNLPDVSEEDLDKLARITEEYLVKFP